MASAETTDQINNKAHEDVQESKAESSPPANAPTTTPLNNTSPHQQIRVPLPDEDDSNDDGSNGHGETPTTPTLPPICTPTSFPLLQQNKSNPFASSSSFKPLLRPSAFKLLQDPASNTTTAAVPQASTTPFVLRPSKLLASTSKESSSTSAPPTSKPVQNIQFVPLEKEDEKKDEDGKEDVVVQETSAVAAAAAAAATAAAEPRGGGSFVFGKNLEERVMDSGGSTLKRKVDEEEKSDDVKKRILDNEDFKKDIQVITGEENEVNVLQLACRLFIFDSQKSSWVERGRGLLRLNDSKPDDKDSTKTSRLIIRTKGSLRVMLNTKVWEGMRVEKASDKSVRIMAVDLEQQQAAAATSSNNSNSEDDRGLRIFLIMLTSISDAFTLTSELNSRVQKLVQDQPKPQ